MLNPFVLFLNPRYYLAVIGMAIAMYATGEMGWFGENVTGLSSLAWGFFLPTVLILHATSAINSVGHARKKLGGHRRFSTDDRSVNSLWLSLITLGGGWHNNHHRYAAGARTGLVWWEVDVTYYVLRLLSMLGIVWSLRPIPQQVYVDAGLVSENTESPDAWIDGD